MGPRSATRVAGRRSEVQPVRALERTCQEFESEFALKTAMAMQTREKVQTHCPARRMAVASDSPAHFARRSRVGLVAMPKIRKNPCKAPHIKKFQLAPCQSPLSRKVNIVLIQA